MKIHELPDSLPLYEAEGTILLPRAQLPIMVQGIEERESIEAAFKDGHRLLGVIQSNPEGGYFHKGCAGRIIHFQEGPRVFIILGGLCRFHISEILEGPVKKARVTYQGYEQDLEATTADPFVNRPRLLGLLKEYLDDQDILANWDEIDHASDDLILNSLTMACPFDPLEKQALLETSSLSERCDMIIALMEMAHSPFQGKRLVLH
jgi:Lon protease-like protein